MKISQKSPKKSAPAELPGAAPQTPLAGGTPRESTPVAPGAVDTPGGAPEILLSFRQGRRRTRNLRCGGHLELQKITQITRFSTSTEDDGAF